MQAKFKKTQVRILARGVKVARPLRCDGKSAPKNVETSTCCELHAVDRNNCAAQVQPTLPDSAQGRRMALRAVCDLCFVCRVRSLVVNLT